MKNILFVVHRIPYPPNKGDKIRTFNELKYLAKNNSVDLLCIVDVPDDIQFLSDLESFCGRADAFVINPFIAKIRGAFALMSGKALSSRYFYNRKMQATFDHWMQTKKYDAVMCFSSSMAEYIFQSKTLSEMASLVRPQLVMDFCDVDSQKWRQYSEDSKFPLNWLYKLESRRLTNYEQLIQDRFDKTTLVSQNEAEFFWSNYNNSHKLSVVPNGVDHEYFCVDGEEKWVSTATHSDSQNVVFTGAMDYAVNINGVLWFVHEVLPSLRAQFPALHFYIVGSNPPKELQELGRDNGITVTGFVQDIREYYALADVCVAPLHQGRGVQNKLLEAMSMKKPVVSTSMANAGVQGTSGEHLVVADSAADFASAVARLLTDEQVAHKMGNAARDFVISEFDWESNMSLFDQLLSRKTVNE